MSAVFSSGAPNAQNHWKIGQMCRWCPSLSVYFYTNLPGTLKSRISRLLCEKLPQPGSFRGAYSNFSQGCCRHPINVASVVDAAHRHKIHRGNRDGERASRFARQGSGREADNACIHVFESALGGSQRRSYEVREVGSRICPAGSRQGKIEQTEIRLVRSARHFVDAADSLIKPRNQPRCARTVGIIFRAKLRAQQRLFRVKYAQAAAG